MNGRAYFLGALYHTSAGFSQLSSFMRKIGHYFDALAFDRRVVLAKVQELIEQYRKVEGKIGDIEALQLLIASDLKKLQAILLYDNIDIDREADITSNLYECRDKATEILIELGMHLDPPSLFVVEQLPSPYEKSGFAAVACDEGDEQKYGITPGLYFVKNRLLPFYSAYLLMHEMIHAVIGQTSPQWLGRGLEEGLAELIGSLYLSARILGFDLTKNLFTYSRLGHEIDQYWEIYLDYTRQALFLYHEFGLAGLVSLINSGREKIKEVEECCLRMDFEAINLPRGNLEPTLSQLANYLTLTFGRNLVVSPLAKYLAPYIRVEKSILEICAERNVQEEAGQRAIKELEQRIFALVLNNQGRVSISDLDFLAQEDILRYEIPK